MFGGMMAVATIKPRPAISLRWTQVEHEVDTDSGDGPSLHHGRHGRHGPRHRGEHYY